jgi:hypothetical protein
VAKVGLGILLVGGIAWLIWSHAFSSAFSLLHPF